MPEPNANIKLYLEGMILMFFRGKSNNTATSCQVGVLRNAPGHMYEIRVLKKGPNPVETVYEEEDIRFTLALKVENPTPPTIEFHDWVTDFDRLKGNASRESFNWVLDLEEEVYKEHARGIGADRKQFRSVLSLDTGLFFTGGATGTSNENGISLNDLLICDENCNPRKFIGKVATRVGVAITLSGVDSKATFFNGNEILFDAGMNDSYEVRINRIRVADTVETALHAMTADHAASHHDRDANNFYNAVGQNLAPDEKFQFVSTTPVAPPTSSFTPAGPEAACLVGLMSRSRI